MDLRPDGAPEILDGSRWPERAKEIAGAWRLSINASLAEAEHRRDQAGPVDPLGTVKLPTSLAQRWARLADLSHLPATGTRLHGHGAEVTRRAESLLHLCLVADEASGGIGLTLPERDALLEFGEIILTRRLGRSVASGSSSSPPITTPAS